MILTDHETFWRAVLELKPPHHKELDHFGTRHIKGGHWETFPPVLPLSPIGFPSSETKNRRCLISQSVHLTEGFHLKRRADES